MQTTTRIAVLAMTASVLCCASPTIADTEVVDGITWTYTVSDGEASVGGTYSTAVSPMVAGAIAIPSSFAGIPVTSIGTGAFNECYRLTSVTIPDSVRSIGNRSFRSCYGLVELTIPDGVTTIGYDAFAGCDGLRNVVLGNGVTDLTKFSFCGNANLTNVVVGSGVTSIGDHAFSGCSGLTVISIGNGVTSIGDEAFYGCSCLTGFTIPDGVTNIGVEAFAGCSRLASIPIPNSVTNIGEKAFINCSELKEVTIPDSVKNVGENAFLYCSGLTNITADPSNRKIANLFPSATNFAFTIPSGVKNIGEWAFAGCSGLTSVLIPDGVQNIGYEAFKDCDNLITIEIPDSVYWIGRYAFGGCSRLETITFGSGLTSIVAQLDWDYESPTTALFKDCSSLATVVLPEAYSGTTLWIPSSATILRYRCRVVLDPSPVALPENAKGEFLAFSFYGNNLPVLSRLGYSFSGWSLDGQIVSSDTYVPVTTNHTLTATWTPNEYTVLFDATGGLVDPVSKSVTFDAAYGALPVPTHEGYVFLDWLLGDETIHTGTVVEAANEHTLRAKWGISFGGGVWEETICGDPITLGTPLVAPSGDVVIPAEIDGRPVVSIGADAFAGNTAITSIAIPSSVTNIAEGAFEGCTGIKTVYFTGEGDLKYHLAEYLSGAEASVERVFFLDGVTAIPDDFFEGCTALETMDIAESVVDIGTNVFEACSALETTVTNGLELYQGWVLGYADAAAVDSRPPDLVIPDGVRGIAANAFEGEWGVGTLTMPETLRFVGARAFNGCTALESIAVPEGVAKIDREAFRNCTWAQGLALPGTLREIGDGAFANDSTLLGAVLPEGVVSVGECAFSNCWRMLSVSIPQSVERIGGGAFADCRRLTGVTVPLHVRPMEELFPAAYSNLATVAVASTNGSLGELASPEAEAWLASRQMVPDVFKGCTALEGIDLPAWVCNVSDGAFEGCAAIESLAMPDAVTNVGARACASMAALVSVAFPASLVSIGDEAFDGDAAVASLVLPEGLRSIGERAFRGLALLARADVPGSVRTIGDGAFAECASIRAVSMPGDAGTVAAVFPDAYLDIVSATVVAEDGAAAGDGGPPVAMEGLFEGCTALTRIELPQDLAEIGAEAFAGCTSLAEIGIPATVTNLGSRAFSGCGSLSTVALPKNLEELRDGTFAGCASLSETVIPESVRELGNGIFDGCTLLRSVKYVGNAPAYDAESGGPYSGLPAGAKSYVANGSKGWDGYATSMSLPEYWPAGTTYEIDFWTPNRFDVAFDPKFGDEAPVEVEQVTGTSYVLPVAPVRLGARFAGWWTERENGARISASTQVTATRPHTFYAHWTLNRYHVHFDASGGNGTADPLEMTVGTPAALPQCPFSKIGSAFAGWSTEPDGAAVYADGAVVVDLAYANNASVTLYAVWQERPWTLSDYLDAPELRFGTAGGGEWTPDWEDFKSGGVSLRCEGLPPAASDGFTNATLRTAVTGAGTLAFWWKVDCEENDETYDEWYDYATFAVDGAEIARIAGESGWRRVECAVSGAGEHELLWTFTRDGYD